MTKAIIFDLDGTLLNTITTIKYYCDKALTAHGFNEAGESEYKLFVGNGAKLLVERAMSHTRTWSEDEFNKVFSMYNELYNNDTLYLTEPYAGIVELLKALKSEGYKLAVLSNKPHPATIDVVGKIFGEGAFDLIRGGMDGVPLKPDPTAVFEILNELGIDKSEAVFVGDTKVDIQTGKNADLFSIGVLWGFRDEAELKAAGANAIVSNTEELLSEIRKRR